MSYCLAIENMSGDKKVLHIHDDDELFCRLILEINQAGLSWETILKKVAGYTNKDRSRLLGDAGIIRNHLKVNADIENSKAIMLLQKEYGSFLQEAKLLTNF